jgi:predicted SnoaL-like aldol condensation-catalyzing enzyme
MEMSETFLVDRKLEENKAVVREFYQLAFHQRKPEEAMARYVQTEYCQHNPRVGDGVASFIAFVKKYIQAYPNLSYTFKRIIAEGDLVMLHSHLLREPTDRGLAVVDIVRLEDGKIAEHWDVIQEVPEFSANSNSMF